MAILDATTRNMTAEEIIREYGVHDNPIIEEIVRHLDESLSNCKDLKAENEDLRLTHHEPCDECSRLHDEIEKLETDIERLEQETGNHETRKPHTENSTPMLEEKVAENTAALRTLASKIDALISALAVTPPAPTTAVVETEPVETEPTPEPAPEPPVETPSVQDVQQALVDLKACTDRETVLAVLRTFIADDEPTIVGSVPEARYADVIAATRDAARKAAPQMAA